VGGQAEAMGRAIESFKIAEQAGRDNGQRSELTSTDPDKVFKISQFFQVVKTQISREWRISPAGNFERPSIERSAP
jgi:hypothetical protein